MDYSKYDLNKSIEYNIAADIIRKNEEQYIEVFKKIKQEELKNLQLTDGEINAYLDTLNRQQVLNEIYEDPQKYINYGYEPDINDPRR